MALTEPGAHAADAVAVAVGRVFAEAVGASGVVLVEGRSDLAALRAAARVLGRDLDAERIAVVAMDGITNLVRCVQAVRTAVPGVPLAALCDASEERWLRRTLRRMTEPPRIALCDRDLEDELIRALGVERTLAVLADAGELAAFRVFQGQPAQRARPVTAQLHRFLGVASGRKQRLAGPLTAALAPAELPAPFTDVLTAVA